MKYSVHISTTLSLKSSLPHPVALRIEERTKGATTKVVKLEKNCTPLLTLPSCQTLLLTEILHSFNLNEMVVEEEEEEKEGVRFVRLTL